ncbi:MAG TPA: choice-of-anchor V domain-containing protein [Thermoanaerobaculia bacterium]
MRRCRERAGAAAPLAGLTAAAALALAGAAGAYVDRAPPGHTGGFDEPTCVSCHRGEPANSEGGGLEIVAPATFAPGEEHVIEVRLARRGMARGGFVLSARWAEGERAGRQAGELLPPRDASEAVQVEVAHEVAYAGHTASSADRGRGGAASWRVRWRAPREAPGPVVFHAAANAADYDDSEYGDFVYTASATARPARRSR